MISKTKPKNRFFKDLKDLVCDCYYQSKIKFFVILFIVLISLITGIIVAVKCFSSSINGLGEYGIVDLSNGLTSSFFSRLFSMILFMLLLFGFSYTKFCMPLAFILIAYRSYLLGLNLALMFLLYGFPGIIVSVIVALPCQLVALAIFCIFYLLQCKCSHDFCDYKGKGSKEKLQLLILTLILILVLCILETLLLLLLNAKVILVI